MNMRELVTGEIGSPAWLKAVGKLALTLAALAVAWDAASTGYGALRAAVGLPAYDVVSVQRDGAVVVIREHGTGTLRLCAMDGQCHGEVNVAAAGNIPPPPAGFVRTSGE